MEWNRDHCWVWFSLLRGTLRLLVVCALSLLLSQGRAGSPPTALGNSPRQEEAPPPHPNANPIEVLSDKTTFFLKIDLRNPRVHVEVLLPHHNTGGREPLYKLRDRLQGHQWAIINADLFSHACPAGVNCSQGLTYLWGEHRPIWPAYDQTHTIRGNIGFDEQKNVEINVDEGQSRRYMTIGGGPRIVIGGGAPTCTGELLGTKTLFPASGEWFDDDARWWCNDTRSISMVGHSADGRYLYMGLSKEGKNVVQTAQWLKDRGAHEVLRFDSGGSSNMYFNGMYIAGRGSQERRPIASALAVIVDPPWHEGTFPLTTQLPAETPPAVPAPPTPPALRFPANGSTLRDHTITFQWDAPTAEVPGFFVRVKDSSDMQGEGWAVVDEWVAGTGYTLTVPSHLDERDLYWSVRADVPGAQWAPPHAFRIMPTAPSLVKPR